MTARSALFGLLLLAAPAQAAPSWTVLFNGKNLDNFDIAYASKPVDSRPAKLTGYVGAASSRKEHCSATSCMLRA